MSSEKCHKLIRKYRKSNDEVMKQFRETGAELKTEKFWRTYLS